MKFSFVIYLSAPTVPVDCAERDVCDVMFVMFAVYAACITRGFVALLSFYSPFLLPLSMLSMLFQAKTERILCRDRGNAPVSRACESAGTTLLAGCFCLHKGHKVNLDIYPRA